MQSEYEKKVEIKFVEENYWYGSGRNLWKKKCNIKNIFCWESIRRRFTGTHRFSGTNVESEYHANGWITDKNDKFARE